jgi:hypothetical protein
MLLRRGIEGATRWSPLSCGAAPGRGGSPRCIGDVWHLMVAEQPPDDTPPQVSAGASGRPANADAISDSENSGSSRVPARKAS